MTCGTMSRVTVDPMIALRIGAWCLLLCAFICGVVIAVTVGTDLYVRTHWPMVQGNVIKAEPRSTRVSSRDRRPTLFWVEFEVEFDPKEVGCNTGASWAVAMRFPCLGTVRSAESSWGTPSDWIQRHPAGSPAKLYYDPKTGHLRFAEQSVVDTFPMGTIVLFLVSAGASIWLFHALKSDLRSGDADGDRASSSIPDELTELKLS